MTVNPGLKSRFSTRLHFPDFSPEDALQLLLLTLRREYSLEPDTGAAAALPDMAQQVGVQQLLQERGKYDVLLVQGGALCSYSGLFSTGTRHTRENQQLHLSADAHRTLAMVTASSCPCS